MHHQARVDLRGGGYSADRRPVVPGLGEQSSRLGQDPVLRLDPAAVAGGLVHRIHSTGVESL